MLRVPAWIGRNKTLINTQSRRTIIPTAAAQIDDKVFWKMVFTQCRKCCVKCAVPNLKFNKSAFVNKREADVHKADPKPETMIEWK